MYYTEIDDVAKDRLVTTVAEATANIDQYERELARSADLRAIMSYARAWHGYKGPDGVWRMAPSKFIGYANNDAVAYTRSHRDRDGRRTERALSIWFDVVEQGSAAYEDMTAAVLRLFAKYGRAPNKLLRVSRLRIPDRNAAIAENGISPEAERTAFRSRITVDASICSGRPTIRGMRIRVSDILDMLAAGATKKEIVADYPYLEEKDVSAALEYAAEAADHRIVRIA